MIHIRPAKEGDAAMLAAIGLRAWEDATAIIGVTEALRDNARFAFSHFAQSSWSAITLAELDGMIAGWAARENFNDRITDFWVDPTCQRRGVGAALLEEVEQQVLRQGFDMAQLESHAENSQAITFFKKHGYSVSWLSAAYSAKLDRDVQSIGLKKLLITEPQHGYGSGF